MTDRIALSRRGVLSLAGGAVLSAFTPPPLRAAGKEDAEAGPLWLSAYATAENPARYGVALLDAEGSVLVHLPLPGRAHEVAVHPNGTQAVVFARRPGRWYAVIDLDIANLDATISAPFAIPDDRRGTGHGRFSPDGSVLFMAEDDVPHETGVIALLDPSAGYARVGTLPGHGVGPHEVLALDGGKTLAVANGGVITHPDTGRVKLNVESMAPNLTIVDVATGALIEEVTLPRAFNNLGIRHAAALPDGRLVFGMQDERPTGEVQPLVAAHRRGDAAPTFLDAPEDAWARFKGYIGAVSSHGDLIAATSPRGGVVGCWNAVSGAFLGLTELPDGCGVANAAGIGFVATSGYGRVTRILGADHALVTTTAGYRWDNHITILS